MMANEQQLSELRGMRDLYGAETTVKSFLATHPGEDGDFLSPMMQESDPDTMFEVMMQRLGAKAKGDVAALPTTLKREMPEVEQPSLLERAGKGALGVGKVALDVLATGGAGKRRREGAKAALGGVLEGRSLFHRERKDFIRNQVRRTRQISGKLPAIEEIGFLIDSVTGVKGAWPALTSEERKTPQMEKMPLEFGSDGENRQTLSALAREGKIPTPERIIEHMGEKDGWDLVKRMASLSPKFFYDPRRPHWDPSWQWRGENRNILPVSYMLRHPYIAAAVDGAILQGARDLVWEEVTNPEEWIIDFIAGKFLIAPAVRAMKARAGVESIKRLPVTKFFRRAGKKSVGVRRALSSQVTDAGASSKVIQALMEMSDEELRLMSDAVREGKKVSIQIPEELLKKPGKLWKKVQGEAPSEQLRDLGEKFTGEMEIFPGHVSRENLTEMADITGYSEMELLRLRSLGLEDADIVGLSAADAARASTEPSKLNTGDKVKIAPWYTEATIVNATDPNAVVLQLDTGAKVKVPMSELAAADVPTPPAARGLKGKVRAVAQEVPVSEGDLVRDMDGDVLQVTDASDPGKIVAATDAGEEVAVPRGEVNKLAAGETSSLDRVRVELAKKAVERKRLSEEGGFVRIRKGGGLAAARGAAQKQSPVERFRGVVKDVTGDTQYADDMSIWLEQNTLGARVGERISKLYDEAVELTLKPVDNNALLKVADPKKSVYPENVQREIRQFVDELRTGANTYGTRGKAQAMMDTNKIWGHLDNKQQQELAQLIFHKSNTTRAVAGSPITSNLSAEDATEIFRRMYDDADPEVQQAFEWYKTYSRAFGLEHIVKTGHLSVDDMSDFYVHHEVLTKMYRGNLSKYYLPRRLRKFKRGYLKAAKGSTEPIAVDLDALVNYHATVLADNATDDFATRWYTRFDAASKKEIAEEMGEDWLKERLKTLKPGQTIVVDGQTYVATQYDPGRYFYKQVMADPGLVAESIDDALVYAGKQELFDQPLNLNQVLTGNVTSKMDTWANAADNFLSKISHLPVEQQYDELLKFTEGVGPRGGSALRTGIAVGKYKPVYLVPQEVANKFNNLKAPADFIPLMRDVMRATSYWKAATLMWAGVPYHALNLFGDTLNMELTAPGAVAHVPRAVKILAALEALDRTPRIGLDKYDMTQMPTAYRKVAGKRIKIDLTPDEKEILQIVLEGDVLGSGFLREVVNYEPITTGKGLTARALRWSGYREAVNRVSMTSYQWTRYKSGKPFDAIQMEKTIKYLQPDQAAAYIGRNAMIDYGDIPPYYRRYIRGFLFPFLTFTQKNALNMAGILGKSYKPKQAMRMALGVAAPAALIQAWNRGMVKVPGALSAERRRNINNRMGYFRGRMYTVILDAWDDDGDGVDDRAKLWSPRTPLDEAAEWIGIDDILMLVAAVERGRLTKKEAAKRAILALTGSPPEKLAEMITPMVQIMEGLKTNRDPYDKSYVVPPERQGADAITKRLDQSEYVIEKLITAYGQFARKSAGARGKSIGPEWMPEMLRRIGGITVNGPFNIPRALGFYEVDLRANDFREVQDIRRDMETRENAAMWRITDGFVSGDRRPDEFVIHAVAEALKLNKDPQYNPEDKVGKYIKDAHDRGLFVSMDALAQNRNADPKDLPIDPAYLAKRLESMVWSYQTWVARLKEMDRVGIDFKTGEKLTTAKRKEVANLKARLEKAMIVEYLTQGSTLAVRPAMIAQVKQMTGYGAKE